MLGTATVRAGAAPRGVSDRPPGVVAGGTSGGRSVREDVHDAASTSLTEAHQAIGRGEEGVIATAGDVLTRMEAGAALAHEDRAGGDRLTVKSLHAESLGAGVPSVARRAATLGL